MAPRKLDDFGAQSGAGGTPRPLGIHQLVLRTNQVGSRDRRKAQKREGLTIRTQRLGSEMFDGGARNCVFAIAEQHRSSQLVPGRQRLIPAVPGAGLVVIPPALGYTSAGKADAGILGTDDLVFVVDILGLS